MEKRVFKTTQKLSGVRKTFRKWSDWKVGDAVIGKYIGVHTDQYDKDCMILEVADAHFAKASEGKDLIGKNLVLNSAGQLNVAMGKISTGQMVQVTYNGTSVIEKGKYKGKDAHLIEVDLVEEESDAHDEDEGHEWSDDSEL